MQEIQGALSISMLLCVWDVWEQVFTLCRIRPVAHVKWAQQGTHRFKPSVFYSQEKGRPLSLFQLNISNRHVDLAFYFPYLVYSQILEW